MKNINTILLYPIWGKIRNLITYGNPTSNLPSNAINEIYSSYLYYLIFNIYWGSQQTQLLTSFINIPRNTFTYIHKCAQTYYISI